MATLHPGKFSSKIACVFGLMLVLSQFCHAAATLPASDTQPVVLQISQQTININGRPAKIFTILQPDGTWGYLGTKNELFNVIIENHTNEDVALHWHGLLVPNDQEGAPYVTQKPIPSGGAVQYRFRLKQGGTYWFHSHYKAQQQALMAAPFIVYDPDEQPVVNRSITAVFQDYTFQNNKQSYKLFQQKMLNQETNQKLAANGVAPTPVDLSMDAYLTNHRTLNNPYLETIHPGDKIRIRLINASSNSNFFVNLGTLQGAAVAVDGHAIEPVIDNQFQLGIGQRLDIIVIIPEGEGAYPILAQAEGTSRQTGLIMATPHASIPVVTDKTNHLVKQLDYAQEIRFRAIRPLPLRPVDRYLTLNLEGNLLSYSWFINGSVWPNATPLKVAEGNRVEMTINNKAMLALPLHLYGHAFAVTEINGTPVMGALRDTIVVAPASQVKIQFDADNPGTWLLRAAIPFYWGDGMTTLLNYTGFNAPIFNPQDRTKQSMNY